MKLALVLDMTSRSAIVHLLNGFVFQEQHALRRISQHEFHGTEEQIGHGHSGSAHGGPFVGAERDGDIFRSVRWNGAMGKTTQPTPSFEQRGSGL